MPRYDFGFVLKTIEDLTVYDQRETPHIMRVDEHLCDVNDYLSLELWDSVKSTHPKIREFHACCFLSDRSYNDGNDSRFIHQNGEFEAWCGIDKKSLEGLRFNAVRKQVLTTLLEATGDAMRKKEIGGYSQFIEMIKMIIDGIAKDADRHRKAKKLLEDYAS